MRRGAVVLAGGRSTRMGSEKATLPFGPETMLQRVVRLLVPVVGEIVVVARPGQALPALPAAVRVAFDDVPDEGPLRGLAGGLAASRAEAVYATSCDVPFLRRPLVDLLFERMGDHDAAVAEIDGFVHPLTAVYRRGVLPHAQRLLAAGRMRLLFLLEDVASVRVGEADLRRVDPELETLENLNTPEAYEAALRRRKPLVRVELYEVARRRAGTDAVLVDAATLGEALDRTVEACPALAPTVIHDGRLAPTWRASLDGRTFVQDPATPLRDGASLLLVSALAGG